MADWQSSGRVKVERAKEHIRNLEAEIQAFAQRNPYEGRGEIDSQTGDWVLRAHIKESPPPRLGAIAGDAAHNLRSSLDILWRNVMHVDDLSDDTGFPIYNSVKAFESRHGRVTKGWR